MSTLSTVSPSSVILDAPAARAPQARAVDLSSAERMEVLRKLNAAAGYVAPQTILPEGTALWDVGEEKLARQRADVAALPTLATFAPLFLKAEEARSLKDVKDNLSNMRMSPTTGKINRILPDGRSGPAIGYTPTGLSQLVALYRDHLGIPSGASGTLMFLGPKARAEAFNDIAERAEARMVHVKELPDRVFRTALNAHGERYLRAVTSTSHVLSAGGYAAMVRELARLWPEAKVRAVRTEDRFDIDVIFPMHSRQIQVGDVLMGTMGVTLSETKDISARVRDSLLRCLCANLTVAEYGQEGGFTRRHVGAAFVREMANRIKQGWDRLKPFVDAFGDAYQDAFPAALPTRAEVVTRTFKAFKDETKALAPESVIAAWDLDGARSAGNTRAGLVNALTRASQTLGVDAAEQVETAAGALIEKGWGALS